MPEFAFSHLLCTRWLVLVCVCLCLCCIPRGAEATRAHRHVAHHPVTRKTPPISRRGARRSTTVAPTRRHDMRHPAVRQAHPASRHGARDKVRRLRREIKISKVHPALRHGIRAKTARTIRQARAHYTRSMEVTAYCPNSCGNSWHTSLGTPARRGVIAVDPHAIPMGTLLYVPGYGYGRAADQGSHMRGGQRIDICLPTLKQARRWGRRNVCVTVYRKH